MTIHPEPAIGSKKPRLQCLFPILLLLPLALLSWFALSRSSVEDATCKPPGDFEEREAAGWTTITSTMGKECLVVTADRKAVRSAEGRVLLFFEGVPRAAYLALISCGVNPGKYHTIYLNGEPVAQSQDDTYNVCTCSGRGLPVTYKLDNPAIVINGWNHISITNDADVTDSWMAHGLQLIVKGDLTQAVIKEFSFISSYDGSTRYAVYQIPIGYVSGTPAPLLVSIGGTLEDKWDALSRFVHQGNARGWLLMAPDIRRVDGESLGRTAALGTQHDIIDAIHWMSRHFDVDTNRIYMSGFSTGGGIAATVAAKYPDVFAAVVVWKGPTNLLEWIEQRPDLYYGLVVHDFGCPPQGGPTACPFEWKRRSAREFAMNLKHVPMAIVHGRADERVAFAQSKDFYDEMAIFYNPEIYNKLTIWHDGGHVDSLLHFDGLDFMSGFTLNKNPTDIMIKTDESKRYYWVYILQKDWNGRKVEGFSNVIASYDLSTRVISATVWDERVLEGASLPVDVVFDLRAMGFDSSTAYIVEDYQLSSGELKLHKDVWPLEGYLTISVPCEQLGEERHRYLIYPSLLSGSQANE